MAEIKKMTIDQVRSHPNMFMYIFAPDEFLNAIPRVYANEIRGKAANQRKLLMLSAKEYRSTYDEYVDAVRSGFIEQYGETPINALIILAQGGEVAGKNWKEGIYGVGSLSKTFKGTDITVDAQTGQILKGGVALATTNTIYAEANGQSVAYQIYAESDGKRYMSQYNKTLRKYYAQSYSDADGNVYNANGKAITGSDSGSLWETIILCLQTFVDWVISLFSTNKEAETINARNTLPDQKTDGFVYQSGMSDAAKILLALVVGGTLLGGGLVNRKNKSNK